MDVHVVPAVGMTPSGPSNTLLFKSCLGQDSARGRVRGGMISRDPVEASNVKSPLRQCDRRLRAESAATTCRDHPVRQTGPAVVEIHTLQRHATHQRISGLIDQRPVQLRLGGPPGLPGTDPFPRFVGRVCAPHMPALDVWISESGHDCFGISERPRSERSNPAHRDRRVSRSRQRTGCDRRRYQTRHTQHYRRRFMTLPATSTGDDQAEAGGAPALPPEICRGHELVRSLCLKFVAQVQRWASSALLMPTPFPRSILTLAALTKRGLRYAGTTARPAAT